MKLTDYAIAVWRLEACGEANCLAVRRSHLSGQFLETLLQILKVHARGQRDLGLPLLIHGLSKHRYLRGVRQVEHHENRALSVLSEGIEGLRLEAVRDPT